MSEKIDWHPNGTPGPFWVEADIRNDYNPHTERHSGPEYLAGWNVMSGDGEVIGIEGIIPSEQAETNARAIAEVPASVDVHRRLVASLEQHMGSNERMLTINHDELLAILRDTRAILSRIDVA